MDKQEFDQISRAVDLAITRVLSKGTDDVFKPPIFSHSIESVILAREPDKFRTHAKGLAIEFLKAGDLNKRGIGPARRSLVMKDQNTFRQVAWLDPFDAVIYLATAYLFFEKIEAKRIPKQKKVIHSHRLSDVEGEIFDVNFGYDSFRTSSSELSRDYVGNDLSP